MYELLIINYVWLRGESNVYHLGLEYVRIFETLF